MSAVEEINQGVEPGSKCSQLSPACLPLIPPVSPSSCLRRGSCFQCSEMHQFIQPRRLFKVVTKYIKQKKGSFFLSLSREHKCWP